MSYWSNKHTVVVGGSRGLGFAICQKLVNAGARVVLVARDAAKLEEACSQLGSNATSICCDVTDQSDVDRLFDQLVEEKPRLDAFFHVAGKSARGAVLDTSADEFHKLMDLNFYAAVRCTQKAAPRVAASSGHMVFIGSLASKSATRYIGAYASTKFALAAYVQQLRLETSETGLHVLHVCPGPITRSDAGKRYDVRSSNLPDDARQPGAGVDLSTIDANWLAGVVLQGCEQRKIEIIVPRKAKWLFAIAQLSPRLGDWILTKKTKKPAKPKAKD